MGPSRSDIEGEAFGRAFLGDFSEIEVGRSLNRGAKCDQGHRNRTDSFNSIILHPLRIAATSQAVSGGGACVDTCDRSCSDDPSRP